MLPFHRTGNLHDRSVVQGWLLIDAVLALSLVSLTLILTQQALQVTQHVGQQRQARLQQARLRRDQRLEAMLAR